MHKVTEVVEKIIKKKENVTRFIASDGKSFPHPEDCLDYEYEIKRDRLKSLEIRQLRNEPPMIDYGPCSEESDFYWYNVKTKADAELILEVYEDLGMTSVDNFQCPETVCIEVGPDYETWYYFMSDTENKIRKIWQELGYNVKFEKVAN